jgi:integrase
MPRAFGLTPETMPADPIFIAERLRGFAPAMAGLSKGSWNNVLNWTRFSMRRAGIIKSKPRRTEKFAPAWTEIMKLPTLKHDQIGLSRLARYCSEHNVHPDAVDDAVMAALLIDMTTNNIIKNARKVHRRTAVIWNKLATTTRNWPTQTVTVPSYSRVYALPWDRFEPSLVAEIEAHLDRLSGRDLLAKLDCRPLKPGSIRTRRHQLGAYLSGLVLSGEHLTDLKSLADAVTVARVQKGLRFLLARAENGSTAQAHDIARTLVSIAHHEVNVPDDHLQALKRFVKNLDDGDPGMSQKNKSRLRQFDDETNVQDLLGLPAAILRDVKKVAGPVTQAAALRVQTALAIEILLMIPMRRENLTRLNIHKHIDRRRNGNVYIIVPGEEVKNGVEIEAALPAETVKMLDQYLKTYHPVLAGEGSPWIFPGLPGRPKSRERLSMQVSETVKKETGLLVHMHLFRHIAAQLYLDRNVGAYGVVQKLCGHKSIQTTIRSYCGLEVKSAVAHYDCQILAMRENKPTGGNTKVKGR